LETKYLPTSITARRKGGIWGVRWIIVLVTKTRKGPGLKRPWIGNVSNPTEGDNGYGNKNEEDSLVVREGS
jgi:hypothetical protein